MFSSQNSQVSSDANYIEDVFSTYLYQADGSSTQTITNGIDLAGKGGLVWIKSRSNATGNVLVDTVRGSPYVIQSNNTNAQGNWTNEFGSFSSTGFTVPYNTIYGETNYQTRTYASWTFRKQAKFFDVVTYTGNGASTQVISHLLGSAAGCVIVKPTNTAGDWFVYHASIATGIGSSTGLKLNTTGYGEFQRIGNVTSTTFEVQSAINASGDTYVAYLFAHNAGGFGLTGTDNVISCGSFTDTSTGGVVDLGYEPQFVLVKSVDVAGSWFMLDTMRGWINDSASGSSGQDKYLFANSSGAEGNYQMGEPTATGFRFKDNASGTYIYIAIRRGPMKVPTSGTSVFSPVERAGTGTTTAITGLGFTPDIVIAKATNTVRENVWFDRLRGAGQVLSSVNTSAENADANALISFDMNGVTVGADTTWYSGINSNNTGQRYANWFLKRAPSFFDEVCYTGVGYPTALTNTHNLGVAPEMMIVKKRSATQSWFVYHAAMGNAQEMYLNQSASQQPTTFDWNSTTPSATTFTVNSSTNDSGATYVAYLFATCAGVSKVGSYTGTGTTLQVDCGFTGGARFVLIKRTDSTGDWYVWDSARGIVAGNDPYLLLNSTAAEVTNTDYVDTYSAGFEISSTAPAAINASGGSFIFLAVA